uniref:Uncharacterized protein n=1 Tax=Meloidogyne enterolobii TaxID=390850 RepID=A0A6V7UX51_MELEN|nr:unnamed protein product [Meloidogyne enterolobii]
MWLTIVPRHYYIREVHAVEKFIGWEMELSHHGKNPDRSTIDCSTIQPGDTLFLFIYRYFSASVYTTLIPFISFLI